MWLKLEEIWLNFGERSAAGSRVLKLGFLKFWIKNEFWSVKKVLNKMRKVSNGSIWWERARKMVDLREKRSVSRRFERESKREQERNEEEYEGLFTYCAITASRYRDIGESTASRELPKILYQDGEPVIDISASWQRPERYPKVFHQDGEPLMCYRRTDSFQNASHCFYPKTVSRLLQ